MSSMQVVGVVYRSTDCCRPALPAPGHTDHNGIEVGTANPQHHSCVQVLDPSLQQGHLPFILHPANKMPWLISLKMQRTGMSKVGPELVSHEIGKIPDELSNHVFSVFLIQTQMVLL